MSSPNLVKCPSCGAPLALKPGEIVSKCEYCGSNVKVGAPLPPLPPRTIIIETRHRPHRRRIRHLMEEFGADRIEIEQSSSPRG